MGAGASAQGAPGSGGEGQTRNENLSSCPHFSVLSASTNKLRDVDGPCQLVLGKENLFICQG